MFQGWKQSYVNSNKISLFDEHFYEAKIHETTQVDMLLGIYILQYDISVLAGKIRWQMSSYAQ